jgi:hypothetical protein
MIQQIITWLVVGVAAFVLLRHVWAEVDGLIHPDRAGQCPGCGMCEAAQDEKRGVRPPPQAKVTPLVRLEKRRKDHS